MSGRYVYLATGRKGAGKSWRLSLLACEMLSAGWRVLVVEPGAEWPYGKLREAITARHVPWALATKAESLPGMLASHRVVVFRPAFERGKQPMMGPVDAAAGVAAACKEGVALIVPEVHLAARWDLGPQLMHAVTRARHADVNVLVAADTQHPARVSTMFRDDCRWYVHATESTRDEETVALATGKESGAALAGLAEVNQRFDAGEQGWFIVIDGSDSDFTPRRDGL